MMKIIVISILAIFFLISQKVNAQAISKEYSKQDRISVLYAVTANKEMNTWYFMGFPHLDFRYRMSNYSNELDYFSGIGKIGIQGLIAYMHFGAELKFLKMFYVNSTLGMYLGYIGIGIIAEAEFGIRINIVKKLHVECGGSWQLFTPSVKDYITFPSLKIGLGIDL